MVYRSHPRHVNILFLTEEPITFSGTMVRGGQIHVRNVVEGLWERGHNVHLIDWNAEPERPFQHSVAPRIRFAVDPVRTFRQAVSVGRDTDVDIVVSKTRKTYLPGFAAAQWLGVPHVVHVGSSPETVGESTLDRVDDLSVITRLKAPHDGYFVVCESIADDLERLGIGPERIFDVKNAVDTDRFHPDEVPVKLDDRFRRKIEEVTGGTFSLGFVGGLYSYKGLDDLARALEATETDCGLVVAGDGPERRRLQRRIGDRAAFLGPVPYEQIPALYHRIDALVLPSHTEGLPRVVLEAQATGTPVIATRVGGLPEIVDHEETGLLVDARDPDGLAAAIDQLHSDPELRAQIGESGRQAVVESYSWESMYDRYDRYLSELSRDPESNE